MYGNKNGDRAEIEQLNKVEHIFNRIIIFSLLIYHYTYLHFICFLLHAGGGLASQSSQRLECLLFFADLEQLIRWFGHCDETADEYDRYDGAEYAEYQIRHVRADRIRIQETDGDE